MTFNKWIAATPLGSWAKSFLAFMLGAAVVDWSTSGNISLEKWETWVIGGLSATIPPIIGWLNPNDPRFGRGSDA